ncbi:protein kinase 2B, chloroplastic-like [Gossypium australe]|uniref:Protein kinase 2B, chloroplastic-like n=1 Tax=Gossypium australe TaxID=47621 RepID=A0A5B6VC96_9ROSI|nr:protein kinase 2B, chloroplastic-like [Gossypium australe]
MFKQLGLGEPKPIRISIKLVDRSIKYPRDMDEDIEVPKILGQLFLATTRTIIDVINGELVLRVGDEEVTLQAHDVVRVSSKRDNTRYSIDFINHVVQHSLQEISHEDVLQTCPI